MIKAEVSLKNIAEAFDSQLSDILVAVDNTILETANFVRDEARRSAPPDGFGDKTGNLRKSIRRRKSRFPGGGQIVYATGGRGYKGYHAFNVEYGHVKILWGRITGERVKPHPFLRPALDKGMRRAIALLKSNR